MHWEGMGGCRRWRGLPHPLDGWLLAFNPFSRSLFFPEEHGIWIQKDLRVNPYTVSYKLCVLGEVIWLISVHSFMGQRTRKPHRHVLRMKWGTLRNQQGLRCLTHSDHRTRILRGTCSLPAHLPHSSLCGPNESL